MKRTSRPHSSHLIRFANVDVMRVFAPVTTPKSDGLQNLGQNLAARIVAARAAERKAR